MGKALYKNGLVFLLLWAAMLAPLAYAQLPTATILGVVKDTSGAVVPDTNLTARNVETGQARTAVSASDGSFRFSALPVGAYEVRAEHPGFQAEVRSGLTLAVSQEAVVNFTLQVGAVTETVAVTAEAPLVNTTSGSLGGLVAEQKVADLPLNGRNYIDLTLLQTGVTQAKTLNLGQPTGGMWYSSNGAGLRSNNYMLDGALMTTLQGVNSAGATGYTPGVEGIREFRVITNSFSAEYGMTMGSQVIMVSKGGTNSFHGDVFEFLRNSALDARNFFDYKSAATGPNFRLPPYKRNQFGGSAGGPIKKDKTFVYGVYEGLRERLGTSILDNDIAAGCHGTAGTTITSASCPQLAPGTSVTISPVTAPLLALFPLPNLPNNNFTYPATVATRDDFGQIRVDQNFSSNDSMFARYTIDDTNRLGPVLNNPYPQFILGVTSRSQFATLSENHIFSPALLSTARFSFSRTAPVQDSPSGVTGPQYAYNPGPANPDLQMGTIAIGGITTMGPQGTAPSLLAQNVFTWSDDLFYTKGKHSLKFGTLINRFQPYNFSKKGYRGTATFANVAGFLGANPISYVAHPPGNIYARTYRYTSLGFYAQDDYRVTPRLTLNLGLRYEFMTQLHEIYGIQQAIRDIVHDATTTVGLYYLNPTKKNFSPRVGFAWDVMGDGKTAVRGGFGIYYDLFGIGTTLDQINTTPPFTLTLTNLSPAPGSFTIPFNFPAGSFSALRTFDYHLRQSHLLSYNLTVERQLPGGMALTLGYAGSRGIDLVTQGEGNPKIPQILSDGRQFWSTTALRQNPNFNQSIAYVEANSDSWYNALVFSLSKQLSHGLQFQSSYTWSRLIDDTQGNATGDNGLGSNLNGASPLRRWVDRGLADFDTTQNLRFNAIYRLPQMANGNALLKGVLNGWQASGILALQSGYPFTVALQASRSQQNIIDGLTTVDRPDLVPGRSGANITSGTTAGCPGVTAGQKLGTPTLYYDPCAFTLQPAGFLGTAGRNIVRGPGLTNLDFSLIKNTSVRKLGEAGRVEFRAEFFNILNHPNFLVPNRIVFAGTGTAIQPSVLGNAALLTTTGLQTSRQIQLALKVIF
jgi:hypothetical protein